ncbi:MAG: conserved rane protein of unknown function, partial [Hyphomicrobiales bacterium]|nr:conserved rane protein of unknown function [Hyphomicrobiales bacterium]
MKTPQQRPRAFKLDDAAPERDRIVVQDMPDAFAPAPLDEETASEEAAVEAAQRRGMVARALLTWGGLFWSAAGALVSLAVGMWFDKLIGDLFTRSQTLGWIGAALVAALVLSLLVLAGREVAAVLRQKHIAKMHAHFARAREADDRNEARTLTRDLVSLYAHRPETARARAQLSELTGEIVDGRDLIDIADREMMSALDD